MPQNSFGAKQTLEVAGRTHEMFRLDALQQRFDVARLPFSLKVLLENLLRTEGNGSVTAHDIEALAGWDAKAQPSKEIAFTPARVLMQDFTGVPAVVDLAAMRDAMAEMGGDPARINPLAPAELVIDHSVQVDAFGTRDSFRFNAEREFERNQERYAFLRWGQGAFDDFAVVPPDTGIVHQVNLEYLSRVVFLNEKTGQAYPDTLVGTDSHTTMVNGLGVLGWGVGGIEAEAAMLGQPMSMLIPQVLGVRLHGSLPEGATATDLVLTVTELLRARGVVGTFVEFYGAGVAALPIADRATIGNMSPEFGSTCAIFPIDAETLTYLELSGRSAEQIALVEAYAKEQGMWLDEHSEEPTFSDTVELDLATVEPSLAGPKRPQDRVSLSDAQGAFRRALRDYVASDGEQPDGQDEAVAASYPASDPPANTAPGHAQPREPEAEPALAGRRGRDAAAQRHLQGRDARRRELRARPRPRRDRRDHELHQHVEPLRHGRRRDPRAQRARARPALQALGQDLARARLEGRHRVPRPRRSHRAAGGARLQPRRLRLHDLHRQLGSAAAGDLRRRRRGRARRRLGALGQPQLRGAHQPRREDELPRLAAAVRRLRARRHDGPRHRARPARPGRGRRRRLPARHLALGPRGRRDVGEAVRADMFRRSYGEVFEGDERWNSLEVPAGRALRVGRGLDLRAPAAVLRGHARRARRGPRHRGRARARAARRQRHDRPHLAGRLDPARRTRRALPAASRASSRATSTPTARAAATTR